MRLPGSVVENEMVVGPPLTQTDTVLRGVGLRRSTAFIRAYGRSLAPSRLSPLRKANSRSARLPLAVE
jgi:hypothetical protein